ncbi:MAG: hypothetical protein CHACPFDD_03956 [Phycisphaerae bacterium]|nr:hypothetical protein [Phycisphaerae bacterium]
MSASRPVIEFLSLRRSMIGMLVMALLVTLGERMGDRFLPVYLGALGGGTLAIGLLGWAKNALSAVYALPGGMVSQRLGYRRALLLFNALAIAGYATVIVAPSWHLVLLGAALFISWSAVSLPATMALVARVVPPGKRAMGVSLHSLIRRLPMALGPVLGGVLIDQWGQQAGIRIGFAIAIGMALLAMAAQQWLIEHVAEPPRNSAGDNPRAGRSHGTGAAACDPPPQPAPTWMTDLSPPLRHLLASDVLIRFCEQIPDAFVVIWCMQVVRAPVSATQFGVLTAIEMAVAALCYIPVAHYADRFGKRPFVLVTFVFFTLFPLALLAAQSFWLLAAAFVVRGLKEFGDATRKALILDLAPEDRRALTFGTYYFLRDAIVSLAALGGGWLWKISPTANLLAAAAFGAAGTAWFALRGRDVARGE